MWKVIIKYEDKTRLTLTGRQKDIPYRLAVKYQRLYVQNHLCIAMYQQYPKKEHSAIPLSEKINQLEQAGIEEYEETLKNEILFPLSKETEDKVDSLLDKMMGRF